MIQKRKLGRKLLSFLLTLAMVVGLVPGMSLTALATDNPSYTLDGTITGGGNAYANDSDITQNNVSWKVKGNTMENPWRIGGKSLSGENRDVYSTGTINSGITEVMLELGYSTITVNSVTLTVASDSSFSTVLAQQTKNGVAANSTLSFKPSSGTWSNAYYKFTFNVTNSNSSNKYVQFKAAKFYAAAATVPVTGVTLDKTEAQTITVDGSLAFTATVEPTDATDKKVKWSVGGTNADAVKLYSDEACNTEIGADATETLTVYAKGESAGSATVTATSNADANKSASCAVTVNAASEDPYAALKNTTNVITFDSKDWYLIDYDASTVTLLAKECVGASQFNPEGGGNTYSGSKVEAFVNNWYTNNISADAKTAVNGSGMFLLTKEQATTIKTANKDVLKCTKAAGAKDNYWWLCSPSPSSIGRAASVSGEDGNVDSDSNNVKGAYGVRPALKLDLSKVTFDSETKTFATAAPAHTHSFTYAAGTGDKANTITASCGEGCDITTGLTLTISAPTGDLTADGTTTFPATLSTGYNTTAFPGTYTISYTKDGAAFTGTPKDAGAYVASVTVGSATASVSYTVAAATVAVTGVSISPNAAQTIDVGGKVTFTAEVQPGNATDKKVKWSATGGVTLYTDENCTVGNEVTADATSTLTVYAKGVTAGSATVTVTTNADSTKTASCNVTVATPVASVTSNGTTTDYTNFADAVSAWNSAANGATLTLLADVTTASTISVSGTKTLDLNGHGIKGNGGSVILVQSTATLTINDSNSSAEHKYTVSSTMANGAGLATVNDDATGENVRTFTGGYITGGYIESIQYGGGLTVSGTVVMNGGTIIGNRSYNSASGARVLSNGKLTLNEGASISYNSADWNNGGGVYVETDAILEMNGGKIDHNVTQAGGGVNIGGGTFIMTSGSISGNAADGYDGGGVLIGTQGGTFSMSGGIISGNTATRYGGGVVVRAGVINLSGNPTIVDNNAGASGNNIYLLAGRTITVTGNLTNTTAIGVMMESPGVFTSSSNTDYNVASHFTIDNSGYSVGQNANGQLYLVASVTVIYKVANGTWSDGSTTDKTETVQSGSKPASVPTGMIASSGYTGGAWNTNPADATITEATTFTYTFTAKQAVTVAKAPTAKNLTYSGSAQELVTAGEATGGTMYYALGTATEATEQYTTSIPAKTDAGTYYVWYMAKGDENHNDSEVNCIPVTITATYTVTYKVVNGTWSDGTTADKTETVQSGSTPASVPTGMIASSGYTGGAWNTNPADAAITEATTFTYTFSAVPTYTVTYKVVNGTWSDGTTADKTETVQSGSTPASVPTGMIASSGYTGGAWNTNPADAAITEATTFTYTFSAVPVTDVTLNADSAVIAVNGTVTLTATVSPDNATDRKVIWSVSAVQTKALRRGGAAVKLYKDAACTEEVGTGATETLTVYALGLEVGDATVTVTSNANSNKYAICTVSVQDIPHTGDTADFGLWAVLLLAGLAGMGIALTAGKRRKEQQ